jgi:hypothetical protein
MLKPCVKTNKLQIYFLKIFYKAALTLFCALFLMMLTSWATRHAIGGGQRFSDGVKKFVLAFAKFPGQAKDVVGLLGNYFPPKGIPDPYKNLFTVSTGSQSLSGFLLVSCISSNGANSVSLINLSNGVLRDLDVPKNNDFGNQYSDHLIGSESRRLSAFTCRHRIWNPYISREGLITYIVPWNDLIAVDLKTGRQKWRIRGAFHHSIEPDANEDLWVCGAIDPETINSPESKTPHSNKIFEDQALVRVSKTGKILQTISVADLLSRSGLEYLLYGSSNPNLNFDPIHLNQITPINRDAGLLKKGQILISLRNLSTIVLVDPTSQSVVWHKSGKWMNQHCVMAIGPSTFSVLDNHSFASGYDWLNPQWRTRIIKHNIETDVSCEILANAELLKNLKIPLEGRALSVDSDTWIIEDSHAGTIMLLRGNNVVSKWVNKYPDGSVGVTSWCRYISNDSVPAFLLED